MVFKCTYNEEIGEKIIKRIAGGEYTHDACRAEGVEPSTVYSWRNYTPEFKEKWELALEEKAQRLLKKAEEAVTTPIDDDLVVFDVKGNKLSHNARVNRARYRAEYFKWWASKCDKTLSDKDMEIAQLKHQVDKLMIEAQKNVKKDD